MNRWPVTGEPPQERAAPEVEIERFWRDARVRAGLNPASGYFGPTVQDSVLPPAWSFGATPQQADTLLGLVLDGRKTATATALWDYEAVGEEPPTAGELSILLDGAGTPCALIAVTDVRVVPFDEVDAEHVAAEGEGDGSVYQWRRAHERFFRDHATHGRSFHPEMPVVLERFRRLVP